MPATVIVDVFSGLPNPEWTIAGDVLVQLKMMLAHLAQFHGTIPEPPGLGYRGLILEFSPHEGIEGPLRGFSRSSRSSEGVNSACTLGFSTPNSRLAPNPDRPVSVSVSLFVLTLAGGAEGLADHFAVTPAGRPLAE